MNNYYAHSTDAIDKSDWQLLQEHLENVSERSGNFADIFKLGQWGQCAGLLHDAGKATKAFQRRLEGSSERVDHSTFGARLAWKHCGRLGVLLAYVIAGHHGGLPDGGEQKGQLHYRLKHQKIPEGVRLLPGMECRKELKLPFTLSRGTAGFSLSFFTRMIFSCLVDADFLDTEQFCSPDKASKRRNQVELDIIQLLRDKFLAHMGSIGGQAEPTQVNTVRQEIFRQCLEKSSLPRQIFSLTVPTGGGKTFSSMAFALNHAVQHGMSRILYAIPFTSIIEQNGGVFREIFGRDMVLEHHCNFMEKDDLDEREYNQYRRLATENWDMPIVVTTNVQFFESLFASKTSRCRKLHNIAGSVIVLDEAQAIPTEYLKPCLAALRELVSHYGCTIVLCTATQPALDDTSSLRREALPEIKEIVEDPGQYFRKLQRVDVEFVGRKTDEELVELLKEEQQVLCIVATKPQARSVFELLHGHSGVLHLSTNMYPLHRQRVLKKIRERLARGEICRVVSTSLVEAGVDLDFPVVYRAMAGLDSIAQAAGRCNREGSLNEQGKLGRVYVFESAALPSMPWLKRAVSRARETLRALPGKDPLGMETMRRYFELLYDIQELDGKNIMQLLNPAHLDQDLLFPFREAAEKFRFIEEESVGVVIPRETKTEALIHQLRYSEYTRSVLRKLQPYTVSVRTNDVQAMAREGSLEIIDREIPVLCNLKAYSGQVGLCIDRAGVWDVEQLIT